MPKLSKAGQASQDQRDRSGAAPEGGNGANSRDGARSEAPRVLPAAEVRKVWEERLGALKDRVRKHYAKWCQQRQQRITSLTLAVNSCTIAVRQENTPVIY